MGIDYHNAQFIVSSLQDNFSTAVTIGRQTLLVDIMQIRQILLDNKRLPGNFDEVIRGKDFSYADILFELLEFKEIRSIDVSDYEGADIVHDLNGPIPLDLQERFHIVFEGGTLEHVFNFPVAIKNCMEMLKIGGQLLLATPANNFFGHGFYQFSPEIFFRILSPANGFRLIRLIAVDMFTGTWYKVADPVDLNQRVELVNYHPVNLLVQAEKIANSKIFSRFPMQSDYVTSWDNNIVLARSLDQPQSRGQKVRAMIVHFLMRYFSLPFDVSRLFFAKRTSFRNRKFYQPMERHSNK